MKQLLVVGGVAAFLVFGGAIAAAVAGVLASRRHARSPGDPG
jgi:hypothetical protein